MRDMTRELLIRASRPLHMTRAYQTPRFDPRILRSPIFPREFTPMGAGPRPVFSLSLFFFFFLLSGWNKKKRKKKKKLSTNRPHRWAPDLGGYPSLQREIKFWRWWAGNGRDDFLMGNFWGVLYDRKMATGVQVAGWFNFVIVMVNRSCIAIMII